MRSEWEDNLRESLKRTEPPAGFSDRVMAKLPVRSSRQPPVSVYAVLAASLVVLLFGANVYQQHQQQRQAEKAGRELMFALRFTAEKLAIVQARLERTAPDVVIREKERKL